MAADGIELKKPEDLRAMRVAGLAVGRTLAALRDAARPGVTTAELDAVAREHIAAAGAVSSFLGYGTAWGFPPFPGVICASVNEEVVHGIPSGRQLVNGDLLSIDFGMEIAGWHGDSATTIEVGEVSLENAELSRVTEAAMWAGVAAVRIGGRIGDVSHAIQSAVEAEPHRYGILREYTGHGIGRQMHQRPDVPNVGRKGRGALIQAGLAIAIEPMVTLGSAETRVLEDEWTVVTSDRSSAAHWEHTVAVTRHGLWVLTAEDGGEDMLGRLGLRFGPLAD
jgi:methionyl aminopeptidase